MDGKGFAMITESKTCSRCGESKSVDQFYHDKHGYPSAKCKPCHKACGYEWYDRNRESRLADFRLWSKTADGKKSAKVRQHRHRSSGKRLVYEAKLRDSLSKNYVCKVLFQRGFTTDQITPELIAAYRVLIKLKRAVKGIEA
jgi:hypothetical protein